MGFAFAPRGWAYCQGQLLPISTNQPLFSLLGTTYGGDGRTTFALPDLRGRVILGAGQGPGLSSYVPGQASGTESVALQVGQLPTHSHGFSGTIKTGDGDADSTSTNGNYPATGSKNQYAAGTANSSLGASAVTGASGTVGTSQPHENRQPLLAMNYAIALQGVFPSRN